MPAYDDKATDQALEELQKKIAGEYHEAYKEIAQTAKEYWSDLRPRYAAEYKAYQEGKSGYANLDPKVAKAKFDAWYASQIGRGERWEKLRDKMATRVNEANKAAAAYINDTTPGIYSLNANYQAYLIEEATGSADFTIYDERTVADLIQGKTQILPTSRVNGPLGEARAREQLQKALTSGILQGQSIDKIATQFERVTDMNRTAAIRNARTAVTQAQNAGRQDTYERAEAMGIEMQKEWIATEDDRTRDSHAELDGVRVGVHDPYPNGLMYPGDESTGDGSEYYNCRCTERAIITKYNGEPRESRIEGHEGKHDEQTYKKWLDEKRAAKMDESPLTHADATARAMEAKENYARVIDQIDYGGSENAEFTKEELLANMQSNPIGIDTIRHIRDDDLSLHIIGGPVNSSARGMQQGKDIYIYANNINSLRVAGQTVAHEVAHAHYGIGNCQHAEAVCFAHEKMYKEGRDYLTSGEWEDMKQLAIDNYPELEWEENGYGNYEQFDFVRK